MKLHPQPGYALIWFGRSVGATTQAIICVHSFKDCITIRDHVHTPPKKRMSNDK